MKLNNTVSKFETNAEPAESMSFGIGNAEVIIDILRNRMYENKIQTTVQEYISNARDANREVGQAKPIQVTFPTRMSPEFIVRDNGPGVTPDRMANVFVLYGASTKRGTNSQTGGFGLGSKSAWSYTDSFTITTFIDGVKRIYIAHISANKNGRIDLQMEEPTNEPNGTQITIRCKDNDIRAFQSAIIRATMFWTKEEYPAFINGSVVDIKESREIGLNRFEDTNISGVDASPFTGSRSLMVIDGIPYPMPNIDMQEKRRLDALLGTCHYNVFIPNGLVEVAASREKIADSETTKKALKQIFNSVSNDFDRIVKKWEEKIVDLDTMIQASKTVSDFALSTNKVFDYVTIIRGQLEWKLPKETETKLIEMRLIYGSERSRWTNIKPGTKDVYYVKRGARSLIDIKDYIRSSRQYNNFLVTIVGTKPTEVTVDGEKVTRWKRDEKLVGEFEKVLKKLGFKNIEDLIPKIERQAREKKPVQPFNLYQISNGGYENQILLSTLEGKKPVKPWLVYYGNKNGGSTDMYTGIISDLISIGEIDGGFRVPESKSQKIKDDGRFTDVTEFIKTWVPNDKLAILAAKESYYSGYRDGAYQNIKKHVKNKNHILYKIADMLDGSKGTSYYLTNKVKDSQSYKDAITGFKTLAAFFDKHMPLIYNNCSEKHMAEYVNWRLEKIAEEKVTLDLPKVFNI